ncbi:MAG: HAD-IA family hydrolase [Gemmataceae bacterium]
MTWVPPPETLGLIFDCDGTLADTMPVHYRAWTEVLGKHGITFTEERFYSLGGMPTEKIIPILSAESGIPVIDVPAMTVEKENMFLTHLHTIRPIRKVFQIAHHHRGKMPMAVASGGYRRIVEKTLLHIDTHGWFDTIVCAEDTPRHKPEPDVFIEAARRLGVRVDRCVVFEDTDIGLEAAKRAGAIGIDVRPWY